MCVKGVGCMGLCSAGPLVRVNGQLVNHATECSVTRGAIALQAEILDLKANPNRSAGPAHRGAVGSPWPLAPPSPRR